MRRFVLTAALACLLSPGTASAEPTLPPGFQDTVAIGGLVQPMVVRFAPDGRVFVAEKSGLVKVFDDLTDTSASVYADLRTQVYDYWDRGLLGMALAPTFPTDPSIYVLYTRDAAIGGAAPRWGDRCPSPPGPNTDGCIASGRLSRLNAAGNETVLIDNWCQQFPSHSVGQLQFGPDGALYASGGDGASFSFTDFGQAGNPLNPCGDPPAGVGGVQTAPTTEGGSLRAQDLRTSGDPVGLDGTVIRVNPATGAALPTNPLYSNADANARRIIAYGFRNPFRTTFRPGTSELWIGDVGYGKYDEIDRITNVLGTVENGGWPCIEGPLPPPAWERLHLNVCENLYGGGAAAVHAPYFSYAHASKVVPGESCPSGSTSLSGLAFYEGGPYPASYDGALFFADYSRKCIWAMRAGTNGLPSTSNIVTFVAAAESPVALEIGPGGDLFYADFDGGTIRRVRYFTGNQPPTAVASANPTSGLAPLAVSFDGRGSSDPEGTTLSYAWDLDGDGALDDSTSATPSRTYTALGTVSVRLRVTDSNGLWDEDVVVISVGNTAPSATISTPTAATTWKVGEQIAFSGTATDTQDGTLPASAFRWELIIHHCPSNCHTHPVEVFQGVKSGSFVAPDHEYPSHLMLSLTVTDSGGLQRTTSLMLQPRTVQVTLGASVPGIRLTLDDASRPAPFAHTVIENSAHTISAPQAPTVGGVRYTFRSWSDGGARVHNVTAASAGTYTATYAATGADLGVKGWWGSRRGLVTFSVRVKNYGPKRATKIVLTDTLPKRVWYSSATLPGGTCTLGTDRRTVRCKLGALAAGAQRVAKLRVWPYPSARTLVNVAAAKARQQDPKQANNRSRVKATLR